MLLKWDPWCKKGVNEEDFVECWKETYPLQDLLHCWKSMKVFNGQVKVNEDRSFNARAWCDSCDWLGNIERIEIFHGETWGGMELRVLGGRHCPKCGEHLELRGEGLTPSGALVVSDDEEIS